jgi:hypothetical protein
MTTSDGRYIQLRRDYLSELDKVPGKSRDICIQEAISEVLYLPEDVISQETEKEGAVEYTSWTKEGPPPNNTEVHKVNIPDIPSELFEKLPPIDSDPELAIFINTAIRLWLQKRGVKD